MTRIGLVVLGSTGSIGRQTLDVVRAHRDRVRVVALSACTHVDLALRQAVEFGVAHVAFADESVSSDPRIAEFEEHGCSVAFGADAVVALARLDGVDCVLNALVGEAGLPASLACLQAGRRLALANKESLVVGGELLMSSARGAELIPVDSEHSAIFQCLRGEPAEEVGRLWITCSGGPFFGQTREQLAGATPEQTLSHPTWNMGRKITVDSATLMNKGLEVIEAHHLFEMPYDRIRVVIHPESRIHSMVEFSDGGVKAQLGPADMRVPIQYALSYPDRWDGIAQPLDFTRLARLSFAPPDTSAFRCLQLALEAGRVGGTCPCVLNAANEVAVSAFLQKRCGFCDIDYIIETTMDAHDAEAISSLEQIEETDRRARAFARKVIGRIER